MSAQHTPGPWMVPHFARDEVKCDCGYVFSEFQRGMGSICEVNFGSEDEPREVAAANARLIAAVPDLLAAVEAEYIELADIRNHWPRRHTAEGQQKLSRLRDLICKATGREAQDVQDDYGNRRSTGRASS